MAARRLIIVLIVLMLISTLAAALAPPMTDEGQDDPPPPTQPAEGERISGERIDERIEADAGDPPAVSARVGDQLELTVASARQIEVEIAPLGLVADAGPGAPARFSILLREAGTIPITSLGGGEVLGRIRVDERPDSGEAELPDGGRGSDRSGGGARERADPAGGQD